MLVPLKEVIEKLEKTYNASNEELQRLMKMADEETDCAKQLLIMRECLPIIEWQQPLLDFCLGYQEQFKEAHEANIMIKDVIKDLEELKDK